MAGDHNRWILGFLTEGDGVADCRPRVVLVKREQQQTQLVTFNSGLTFRDGQCDCDCDCACQHLDPLES